MFRFRKVDVAAIRHLRKLRKHGVVYEGCMKTCYVLGARCGAVSASREHALDFMEHVPSLRRKHGDGRFWNDHRITVDLCDKLRVKSFWRDGSVKTLGWSEGPAEPVFLAGVDFGMQWAARQELVNKPIVGDAMMKQPAGERNEIPSPA